MQPIGIASSALGAALFLLLTLLILIGRPGTPASRLLLLAALLSTIWLGLTTWYQATASSPLTLFDLQLAELLRDDAWLAFLLVLVGGSAGWRRAGLPLLITGVISVMLLLQLSGTVAALIHPGLRFGGFLGLSLLGLLLVESLYRSTRPEERWSIKLLCLGLGGLFVYDFFVYSHALLFKQLDPELWQARGLVNAMAVPLLALAARRNPQWQVDLFVSRQVVFHSTAITAAGIYLLAMAAAGYWLRRIGGDWGGVLQIAFLFGALLLLGVVFFSSQARSSLKVFLAKHFYRNKYEYRDVWLGFSQALAAGGDDPRALYPLLLQSVAGVMDSPGGMIFTRDENGDYRLRFQDQFAGPDTPSLPGDHPLVRFLVSRGWVIDLHEALESPGHYPGLELPEWLAGEERARLVVPLLHGESLTGFMVLAQPLARRSFDWEDRDLLKALGRQCAGYVSLLETTEALARARQFEAFNRLSAFVVHDLKNLVAQLSLVTANARRFRDNPEFVDDAFATVENAVSRMNRLLANLRQGEVPGQARRQELSRLLQEAVEGCSGGRPQPQLELADGPCEVVVERDRLLSVLHNLIQNAQEATADDGFVRLRLSCRERWARIEVSDNGCGMDPEFIRDRLFRPFDTTKGNAGMGIGVFESREVIRQAGGRMSVESTPGRGTTFIIDLPLAEQRRQSQEQAETG